MENTVQEVQQAYKDFWEFVEDAVERLSKGTNDVPPEVETLIQHLKLVIAREPIDRVFAALGLTAVDLAIGVRKKALELRQKSKPI